MNLPESFPHKAPKGYSYEVEEFKRNVISIWLRHHKKYVYAEGKSIRTIWGFYNVKKQEYYAPINSKTVGEKVDVNNTRSYTSMPIKLSPLEMAFV
jgi:uncharacterized Zn finger protein